MTDYDTLHREGVAAAYDHMLRQHDRHAEQERRKAAAERPRPAQQPTKDRDPPK